MISAFARIKRRVVEGGSIEHREDFLTQEGKMVRSTVDEDYAQRIDENTTEQESSVGYRCFR